MAPECVRFFCERYGRKVKGAKQVHTIITKATRLIAADTITPAERAAIIDEREWQEKAQKERNEGIEQGCKVGYAEIVRSMTAKGLTVEQISDLTGLTTSEVSQLQSG